MIVILARIKALFFVDFDKTFFFVALQSHKTLRCSSTLQLLELFCLHASNFNANLKNHHFQQLFRFKILYISLRLAIGGKHMKKKKDFFNFSFHFFFLSLSSLRFSRRRSRSSPSQVSQKKKRLETKKSHKKSLKKVEISPGNRHRNAINALESSTRRTNVHNVDTFRHSRASFRGFFDHIPLLIEFLSLSDTEYIFFLSLHPNPTLDHFFFYIFFTAVRSGFLGLAAISLARIRCCARSRCNFATTRTSEFVRGR